MKDLIQGYINELKNNLDVLNNKKIENVINLLLEAYKNNKQVFILGNGGSASTASHFACDLGKGTLKNVYDFDEKRFRVVSLTDNVATITAYSNDLSYDDIFVQQLRNLVNKGDVVIGISGSGNSKNVLKAIEYANQCGAITVGFTGFEGGKLREMTKNNIHVNSNHYGRIEDIHLILEHLICSCIDQVKNGK